MALLTISAAARAAGCNRATIQRKIKKGEISVSYDGAGLPQVDTSELLRVFGTLVSTGDIQTSTSNTDATPMQQHAAPPAALVELLQSELKAAKEREARLLSMLEQEQSARRDLEQRMLPPGTEDQRPWWRFWR